MADELQEIKAGSSNMKDTANISDTNQDNSDQDEEEKILDPDHLEERFRVDRRKLEQMIQVDCDNEDETAEDFFHRIMEDTNTRITWPSKLKIGAKSKKDPHIKVSGHKDAVAEAKEQIMAILDTKSSRVTLKMDVSHTEHSHVIGKGGNNIKQVMQETGCHIHFPDSNRNTQAEKSNQVSIAGQPKGVEQARAKIRELLPLVFMFELPVAGLLQPLPDVTSPQIQQIQTTYGVTVSFKQRTRLYVTTVVIRGTVSNAKSVKEATVVLIEHLTGNMGTTIPVSMQLEIAPQHHLFIIGRGGANIKQIMQHTGATIHFPDPCNSTPGRKGTVYLTGAIESVFLARQQLLGCLPLVLMFDMKEDAELDQAKISQLMEQLDVYISIKPKPKQPSKSVIVKSIERNAANLYEARRQLLGLLHERPVLTPTSNHGNDTMGVNRGMTGLSILGHTLLTMNSPPTPVYVVNRTHSPLSTPHGSTITTPSLISAQTVYRPMMVLAPAAGYTSAVNTSHAPSTYIYHQNGLIKETPKFVLQDTPKLIPQDAKAHESRQLEAKLLQEAKLKQEIKASKPEAPEGKSSANVLEENLKHNGIRQEILQAMSGMKSQLEGLPQQSSTGPRSQATHRDHMDLHGFSARENFTKIQPRDCDKQHDDDLYSPHRRVSPCSTSSASPHTEHRVLPGAGSMSDITTSSLSSTSNPSTPPGHPYDLRASNPSTPPASSNPYDLRVNNSSTPPTNPYDLLSDVMSMSLLESATCQTFGSIATSMGNLPFTKSDLQDAVSSIQSKPNLLSQLQQASPENSLSIGSRSLFSGSPTAGLDALSAELISSRLNAAPPRRVKTPPGFSGPPRGHQEAFSSSARSHSEVFRAPKEGSPLRQFTSPFNKVQSLFESPLTAQHNMVSPSSPLGLSGSGSFRRRQDSPLGCLGSSLGGSGSPHATPGSPICRPHPRLFQNGEARSSESGCDSDGSDSRAPGSNRPKKIIPPPLFSPTFASFDYEQKKLLATKAMQKKPEGESRIPTDFWAGLGFSKSMPDSAIRERLNNVRYNGPTMTTTYESVNGELESELWEEEASTLADDMPSSALDGLQSRISAAPGDYPSPRNMASDYAPMGSGDHLDSRVVHQVSTSDWPPKPDLAELFSKRGLGKYTDLFTQQEIDLSTFKTLSDQDLKELGITTFGARRKMLLAIADLNKHDQTLLTSGISSGTNNPFRDGVGSGAASGANLIARQRHDIASQSGRW